MESKLYDMDEASLRSQLSSLNEAIAYLVGKEDSKESDGNDSAQHNQSEPARADLG